MLLKLPRKIEADPRKAELEALLASDLRPLWEGGNFQIPTIPLSPAFESALIKALHFKQLEMGLEQIERTLGSEKKGLDALQKKQGTPAAHRVSRLLIIANDGAERFNRACESLLRLHGDRLLCLHVDVPCAELSQKLFGAQKQVKAILVSDRDAVTTLLFSLLPPSNTPIHK